ncbi:MAG: hypothetical protein AAF500_17660 [Myxococcota bacterium]
MGVIDLDYVAAWAAAQVDAQVAPHWSFCELSLVAGKDRSEVHDLLQEVPGDADPAVICHEVLRILAERLTAQDIRENFWVVWRLLYNLHGEVPNDAVATLCVSVEYTDRNDGREAAVTELFDGLQALAADTGGSGPDVDP